LLIGHVMLQILPRLELSELKTPLINFKKLKFFEKNKLNLSFLFRIKLEEHM